MKPPVWWQTKVRPKRKAIDAAPKRLLMICDVGVTVASPVMPRRRAKRASQIVVCGTRKMNTPTVTTRKA